MNTITSRLKFSVAAFSTLFLVACATPIKSTIDSASEVNISEFATYAWISDEPHISDDAARSGLVNPLNYQRVRDGIDAELQRKGYVQAAISEADLVLGVTLGARDRVRVRQYYDNFGYQYYGYRRFDRINRFSRFNRFDRFGGFRNSFGPYSSTTTSVRTITEGSVAIDVFDNTSRRAIWHGQATRSLTGDAMGRKLIAEAVDALIGPIPRRPAVVAKSQYENTVSSIAL